MAATTQELFDRIIDHFVKQGHRAIVPGSGDSGSPNCQYRAPNGDMCAVGCLISDEAYTPDLEEKPLCAEPVHGALIASGISLTGRAKFFVEMQYAHDYADTALGLRERLCIVAARYNLDDTKVCNITEWK